MSDLASSGRPPPKRGPTPLGAELHGSRGRLGVVVVHEVFGRDDYVRSVADALAKAGYVAAAVDLYDGKYAASLEEAIALRGRLNESRVVEKLDDARMALLDRVETPQRIGTLGFCMGGGYALLGACRLPFDFVVDYYGRIERPEEVAALRGPMLLVLASEDERVTPWAYSELLPAATRARRRVALELYPGVRHAFHRPGWEGHNAAAAADAWRRTLGFLEELTPRSAERDARSGILK